MLNTPAPGESQPAPQGAPPPGPRVELALLEYARSGDAGDLNRARDMALSALPEDSNEAWAAVASPEPLLLVAAAGGTTLDRAEPLMARLSELTQVRGTTDAVAQLVRCRYLYARATRNPDDLNAADRRARTFILDRVAQVGNSVHLRPGGSSATEASLLDYVESLSALVEVASVSPHVAGPELLQGLARRMLEIFWDAERERLAPHAIDTAHLGELAEPFLNARAALVLWRAGHMTGDPLLKHRAPRLARGVQEAALASPYLKADMELALAVLEADPLMIVVVGDAQDPKVRGASRAAYYAFEPLKVMTHLAFLGPDAQPKGLGREPGVYVGSPQGQAPFQRVPEAEPEMVEEACRRLRGR